MCLQLTLRNGVAVAGREDTNVSNVEKNPGDIILEEVIVTGSGNDTRITANALVEDPSRIADGILSLLSKREIRRRRSQETSSNLDESRTVIVNVHDDDDLEKLKNAITEYEPQRITSGKAKRKIIDVPSNTHGKCSKITFPLPTKRKHRDIREENHFYNYIQGVKKIKPTNIEGK